MIRLLMLRMTSVGVAIAAPAVIVVAEVAFERPTVANVSLD